MTLSLSAVDKTVRKYRPLSKGEEAVKDFGGTSTVSVVLPADHANQGLSRRDGLQTQPSES